LRPGAPHYLSPEVLSHLRHAAERARELGLRLDVTLGSGWSYGGAHIGAEHAARRLRWERRELGPEALHWDLAPSWPGDELVSAHLAEGLPPSGWQRLPVQGDRLEIPVGRGPRTVLLAWSEVTGQQVKRSAAGAPGPVRPSARSPPSCSARCSATASRCTRRAGPRPCPSTSAPGAATTCCPSCTCSRSTHRAPPRCVRTTAAPCPSWSRRGSSPPAGSGPRSAGCDSACRATGSRRSRSAPSAVRT